MIPSLLLQSSAQSGKPMDALLFAVLSIAMILILGISGRVNMGFRINGFSRPMSRDRKKVLKSHFPYYKKLSITDKRHFEQKVQFFIDQKTFVPRQLTKVTEQMKVLVAASAVQLTFGFPKVILSHFQRILIYPDDYYSTVNRMYHKGEVNPRLGLIVLSWRAFAEGYIHATDGRNLGLHEMAHAMRLENVILNGEIDFLDPSLLERWHALAEEETKRIRLGESTLFRTYAVTNKEEFFAVAVEVFFEQPAKFKNENRALYKCLALLLNQNPLVKS